MCVCVRLFFKVIKCTPFLITANTWNYLSDTSLLATHTNHRFAYISMDM